MMGSQTFEERDSFTQEKISEQVVVGGVDK